jgi:hypothetical protein
LTGINGSGGIDVSVVCVCVVDGEIASIYFVRSVAGVEIREGSDAGAHPAYIDGVGTILCGAVVAVVDEVLVFMGMAEEYAGDDVGGVSVDDLVEEI